MTTFRHMWKQSSTKLRWPKSKVSFNFCCHFSSFPFLSIFHSSVLPLFHFPKLLLSLPSTGSFSFPFDWLTHIPIAFVTPSVGGSVEFSVSLIDSYSYCVCYSVRRRVCSVHRSIDSGPFIPQFNLFTHILSAFVAPPVNELRLFYSSFD